MFFDVYKHDKCIIYYDLDDEQHVELDEETLKKDWRYYKNPEDIVKKNNQEANENNARTCRHSKKE